MGVVYRARQLSLKRMVAIKMVLAGAHASPDDLSRFRGEAEAAAQLQHPNIVQIYEVGEQDGCPYYSMELVDGGSLAQKTRGAAQSPQWAAQLLETLARAVHAAHKHGIVHRDLKPGNVLLTSDGVVKIADFGLAKWLEADAAQTASGAVLGTPSYMAPEQAAGKTNAVGPHTDVYALGAILYELLTGRALFQSESTVETLLQVIQCDPALPRSLNSAVPRDLETICLKAVAKKPEERYGSAVELADDLARWLNDEPIRARPIGWLGRIWRRCRRNSAVTGVSAVATVIVATVVLLAIIFESSPPEPPDGSVERVHQAGKLVVATDPTYPPMEFRKDANLSGLDIDLARQIARRLGVDTKFVEVDWDWQNLVNRIDSHEFDVLISTVTVTADRQQQVDFVEYERIPMVFVCKEGVAVESEQELAGKVVAVQADTHAHRIIVGLRRRDIPIKQINTFPGSMEPFEALRNGEADVTLAHEPVAHHIVHDDRRLAVTGQVSNSDEPIGVVFSKNDKELQNAVAEAIEEMKRDGTLARLREQWLGH
jgi:ABC-type amino acid transport substrate-binding protein